MSSNGRSGWLFFTNHLQVLLYVARHPDARLRTIADEVQITERAAHRILTELAQEGYLEVSKHGRRNHYRINPDASLRHPANTDVALGPLVAFVNQAVRDISSAHGDEE